MLAGVVSLSMHGCHSGFLAEALRSAQPHRQAPTVTPRWNAEAPVAASSETRHVITQADGRLQYTQVPTSRSHDGDEDGAVKWHWDSRAELRRDAAGAEAALTSQTVFMTSLPSRPAAPRMPARSVVASPRALMSAKASLICAGKSPFVSLNTRVRITQV